MTQTVTIERMASSPEGVGHLSSGKTVFVPNAAPGDVIEIDITEEKPKFARARISRIIEPSSERDPDHMSLSSDLAEIAMSPWAHLSYGAQLKAKQSNVENALNRIAHIPNEIVEDVVSDIVPSSKQWGYRNKLEFAVHKDSNNRICLGVNAQGSHDFVQLKEAKLGNSLLRGAPKAIQGALRYLCGCDDMGIYRVGVRASENTESIEVALWTPPSSFPRSFSAKILKDAIGATSVVRVLANPGSSRKIKRVEVLGGDGFWNEQMNDSIYEDGTLQNESFDFKVSAPSFFQVNTDQAQNMVNLVVAGLGVTSKDRLADLYSGVGTFSFPLAASGADVVSIELEGSSSRDFKSNVELNQLNAEIICDDVARALPDIGNLNAAVVDPPRAGLDKRVIEQLANAAPEKIAYVSCDIQTFARDVARFAEFGYSLSIVTPIDMFPQTYHVECVAVFARV